jgi:hypothetical protein
MTQADQPEPQQPAVEGAQLGLAKVATPQGERLAVQLTMLLDAGQAKAFAAQVAREAESMSASGLVTASGGTVLR